MQRRTADAEFAPGALGFFGGGVEAGETADDCVKREVVEETSLEVGALAISQLCIFVIPAGNGYGWSRKFYLYEGCVPNADFEVYEGSGAEIYPLDELRVRTDLNSSARYIVDSILK